MTVGELIRELTDFDHKLNVFMEISGKECSQVKGTIFQHAAYSDCILLTDYPGTISDGS